MSDGMRDDESGVAAAQGAETGSDARDASIIRGETHWVPARMACENHPETISPAPDQTSGSDTRFDINGQIETLRRELARVSRDASEAAQAVSGDLRAAPGRLSLPRFLRDPLPDEEQQFAPAPEPTIATVTAESPAPDPAQPTPSTPFAAHRSKMMIASGALAACTLIAVLIANSSSDPRRKDQTAPPVDDGLRADWNTPNPRMNFVDAGSCADKPCAALLTFGARLPTELPAKPDETATPGTVVAIAPVDGAASSAVLSQASAPAIAQSTLDPLNTVTIRGLPPSARLSLGQKISDTEWAVTLGDMQNVDIVLPRTQTDPVRADVEIKARDGRNLAAFALNIQQEAPAVVRDVPTDASDTPPAAEPSASPVAAPVAAPVRPLRKVKAKATQRPKSSQPQASAQAHKTNEQPASNAVAEAKPATATVPPSSWFFPAAKPSAPQVATGLATKPAEPAETKTIADQPPGFEILRTLGGGFGLQDQ